MAIGQYFRQFIAPQGKDPVQDTHYSGEYVTTALQAATIAPGWLRKSIVSGVSDVLDCPITELDFMFGTNGTLKTDLGEDDVANDMVSDLLSDLSAELALPEYRTYSPSEMFARPSAL